MTLYIPFFIIFLIHFFIKETQQYLCESSISKLNLDYKCLNKGDYNETNNFIIEKNNEIFLLKVSLSNGNKIEDNKNLYLLKKFKKENIVLNLIDYKIIGENIYSILNYFNNGNLESFSKSNDYFKNEKNIINFFYELLVGVKKIHEENLILTNLNPQNILITDKKEPRIFNFNYTERNLAKKPIRCNFHFIDPKSLELYEDDIVTYNEKFDVFSIGAILYFLVKKEFLFIGKNVKNILKDSKSKKFFVLPSNTSFLIAEILEVSLQFDEKKRFSIDKIIKLIEDNKNYDNQLKKATKIYFDKIVLVNQNKQHFIIQIILICVSILFFIFIISSFKNKVNHIKKSSFEIDCSDLNQNINKSSEVFKN